MLKSVSTFLEIISLRNINRMFKFIITIVCLLLSACAMVGPDYKEPQKNIADHWIKHHSSIKETTPHDASWWKTFHDPTLTTLINQGYHNNLTLQSAGVRVLQERAILAQSVGELYPQQQALVGNYNYQRIGGSSLQGFLPPSFETASLGFSISWELDFWGKYRRAIQANDASFFASLAAFDNALVTLTADIANTYINIRTDEALIKVTQQNIEIQRMGLRIARSRFNAGQTSLLDVDQAQTELYQTEGSLPPLISDLQKQKDMLAVLLGTLPENINPLLMNHRGMIPKAPATVAVGIPKETLGQRPDIHQARLEAMAQSASIGAIKANLFPSLSLVGNFAFAANTIGDSSLSDIFQWSNRTMTVGPSLTWPILNYGQITNSVRAQDAAFQQALLNYLNVVLQAQQEVQDNITQYIEAQKAEKAFSIANCSAMQSTRLAFIRYKEGESDFTTVLDAEQQQLRVQKSLTNSTGDISKALVALYRSLGGGWQIRNGNDIVSEDIKIEMAKRTNWDSLLEQINHEPPKTNWQRIKQLYLPSW